VYGVFLYQFFGWSCDRKWECDQLTTSLGRQWLPLLPRSRAQFVLLVGRHLLSCQLYKLVGLPWRLAPHPPPPTTMQHACVLAHAHILTKTIRERRTRRSMTGLCYDVKSFQGDRRRPFYIIKQPVISKTSHHNLLMVVYHAVPVIEVDASYLRIE
jgi:hypothetical protein